MQQDSTRDLTDAVLRCIVVDEEIAEVAEQCEQGCNYAVATALRRISRNHRIRGMEQRAQLAVLMPLMAPTSSIRR